MGVTMLLRSAFELSLRPGPTLCFFLSTPLVAAASGFCRHRIDRPSVRGIFQTREPRRRSGGGALVAGGSTGLRSRGASADARGCCVSMRRGQHNGSGGSVAVVVGVVMVVVVVGGGGAEGGCCGWWLAWVEGLSQGSLPSTAVTPDRRLVPFCPNVCRPSCLHVFFV
jgi:hypothetical protein